MKRILSLTLALLYASTHISANACNQHNQSTHELSEEDKAFIKQVAENAQYAKESARQAALSAATAAAEASSPAISTNNLSISCAARIMTDAQGNPLTATEMDEICKDEDIAAQETISGAAEIIESQTATLKGAAPTALMLEPSDAPAEIDEAARKESRKAFCTSNPKYAKSDACKGIN